MKSSEGSHPPTVKDLIAFCDRKIRCVDCPEEWARVWLGDALERRDALAAIAAMRDLGWTPEGIASDPARLQDPWNEVLLEAVHRLVATNLDLPYPEPPDEDIEWVVEGCDYVDPESFFLVRSAVLALARMCSGKRAIQQVEALHC